MKGGTNYRVGPGMTSLLMIFVVLCMATLAILAFSSMRADTALTERNVASIEQYYKAAAEVQHALFALDTQLTTARDEANGNVTEYLRMASNLQDEEQSGQDDSSIIITVMASIDDDRRIEAEALVLPSLEGKRYSLRSHRMLHEGEWAAEQSVGYYVPPEEVE